MSNPNIKSFKIREVESSIDVLLVKCTPEQYANPDYIKAVQIENLNDNVILFCGFDGIRPLTQGSKHSLANIKIEEYFTYQSLQDWIADEQT